MAYILFWKRIENWRILLPRWIFGNSIFYTSVIKDVKIFFRMKKVNCSLYETFNYGIQISLLLVTPQTTATTPNGCPKPLPRPTIRQLRTLWHRYATGTTKTAKADNKPTTSTATKSTSHARLPTRTAIWFGLGIIMVGANWMEILL